MLTQNVAGSGQSEAGETPVAVADAVKQALKGLVGRKPRLGFLFASAKHPLKLALDSAQAASPNTEWLACHTSGELTERGLSCGGVSVLLIASDRMHVDVQGAQGVKANHIDAARKLCARRAAACSPSHSF